MSIFFQECTEIIYKHFFSRNPFSFSLFKDLYDLVKQKENFIKYIQTEYTIAIIYNIMLSFSTFLYLYQSFSTIYSYDKFSTIWLILVSSIKFLELIPKLFILWQTNRIMKSSSNNDSTCMRRLLNMIRSNIFFYNTVLAYLLLLNYSSYLILYKRSIKSYEKVPQLYLNINLLMYGFFLRILITFMNYHFHFKYGINQADIANIDLFSESHKVEKEVFEMIKGYNLSKQSSLALNKENEACCICLNEFIEGEFVKILPCNSRHVFHSKCIEKWLSNNIACPTCRKEVNRDCFESPLNKLLRN